MNNVKIYDLPTRLFHWLFAISFIATFSIAKFVDDESQYYAYHMMLGIFMATLVALRIIWGLVGSEYAKFKSFDLKPTHLKSYIVQAIKGRTVRQPGHNPASSWAAIIMMILSLCLLATGYQMVTKNNKEFFEEIHEILSTIFAIIAVFHILGILFHTHKHKDAIGLSMLHGKKNIDQAVTEQSGISGNYNIVAFFFIVIAFSIFVNIYERYDQATGNFSAFNNTYNLVKIETGEEERD